MVHAIALIAMVALCAPFPLYWRLLKHLVTSIDVAVQPEVYKRLHSKRFLQSLEDIRGLYKKTIRQALVTLLAAVALLGLWFCAYIDVRFTDLTVGVLTAWISWMAVVGWTTEEIPTWLSTFDVEMYRTLDTINLETVKRTLTEVQARRTILVNGAVEASEFQEIIDLGVQIVYLQGLQQDLTHRLRKLPQRK